MYRATAKHTKTNAACRYFKLYNDLETSSVEEHVPVMCKARDSVPVCDVNSNCQLDRI